MIFRRNIKGLDSFIFFFPEIKKKKSKKGPQANDSIQGRTMEYFIKTSQKSKEVTRRCFKADKIPPKNFKGELHRFSQLNNRVSKNLKSIFFLT